MENQPPSPKHQPIPAPRDPAPGIPMPPQPPHTQAVPAHTQAGVHVHGQANNVQLAASKEYALRAIEKTEAWLNQFSSTDTSDELRGVLADKFHETCKNNGLTYSEFEKLWTKTSELAKNPAMAEFLLDSKACDSEFFIPWQNAIPRAVILEAAYGYGYDLRGNYRRVPDSDPFSIWIKNDPSFKFFRWCDRFYADFLNKKQSHDLLFLGAGWLPELRYTDYFEKGWTGDTHITCCDVDTTINKNFIFPPNVAKQVDYQYVGLVEMLMSAKEHHATFDDILAKGVMSYCLDNLSATIRSVMELLRPGGSFVFDLQTPHWSMLRNGYIFGWGANGAIRLLSTDEIVSLINETCVGIEHAAISYEEDPTDQEPVGVVVTITK